MNVLSEIFRVILVSVLSVIVLFITAKFMGHKQLSQLDFFDYLCGITIGSIAAELATELENPLQPLVATIVWGAASILLNFIMQKFPRARKYINGTPTILMSDGELYRDNFKAAKLDLTEFMVLCREAGYFNINDIHTAVFESNGKLTVLPKSTARPLMPQDIKLSLKEECINTEIIMDGRILEDNLKRLGYNDTWLKKALDEQGIKSAREVFFAICDDSGRLTVFKNKSPA